MDEILGDLLRPVLRLFLGFLRLLQFLAWDLLVSYIGWSLGWTFYRIITFGAFPREGLGDLESCSWWKAILVELTGLALLGGLTFFIAGLVPV